MCVARSINCFFIVYTVCSKNIPPSALHTSLQPYALLFGQEILYHRTSSVAYLSHAFAHFSQETRSSIRGMLGLEAWPVSRPICGGLSLECPVFSLGLKLSETKTEAKA